MRIFFKPRSENEASEEAKFIMSMAPVIHIWDLIIFIMNVQDPKLSTAMVKFTIEKTLFFKFGPGFWDLGPQCDAPNVKELNTYN